MKINLKYFPNAANAPLFAQDIVQAAGDISGTALDYSVPSLHLVDGIIEEMRRDAVPMEQVGATLFGFGAYVGEVFTRNAGAHWVDLDQARKGDSGHPIGIQMPDGVIWDPISKVFQRLSDGAEDSLPFFYKQAVARRGQG